MTSILSRRLSALAAVALLGGSGAVFAQATGGPSAAEVTPPNAGQPPEQAAIDACKDKKEGDRVRFVNAKGKKRHWACTTVDGVLAARSGVATPAHEVKKK